MAVVDAQLELVQVDLIPGGDLGNLDFVNAADVQIARIDGARIGAIAWNHPEGQVVESISLEPPNDLDLAQLATGESSRVTTTLTGTLPTRAWSLTVRACYRVGLRYAWDPL